MTRFAALEDLRNRPIGDQGPARAARKGFRTRIPITRDNALYGEAVIEAREAGLKGENFYASGRNLACAQGQDTWTIDTQKRLDHVESCGQP